MSRKILLWLILLWLITGFFLPCLSAGDVLVIGHKNITDVLGKKDIKEIFLGRKTRWSDNEKIHFVILSNKKIYKEFLAAYVGKTLSQYRNYWKMKVFNGTGRMPLAFRNEADVINYVAENKGAIGFVSSKKPENVKIFSVIP